MTSIIFLFELVHLNDLFCDIVEEVDIKGVLKSLIVGVQKATVGAIRNILATSYDVWQRRAATPNLLPTTCYKRTNKRTNKQSYP